MDNPTNRPASQGRPPLRVLHVDTERGWRGGERQLLWLAEELQAHGDVNIIAARRGQPLAARAHQSGLQVVELDPRFEADIRSAMRLRGAIRRHRIDVVHAHSSHAVSQAALATLGSSVPFVAARRVDFPLSDNFASRWKYGRASAVVAVSQAVSEICARAGLHTPIVVIPDGTDVARVSTPLSSEELESLGVPSGSPLVVQVSQLVGHKDPLTFVHGVAAARKRVPKLHALLVGEGELRPEVEAAIISANLGDCLHLLGYRSDADSLLASAHVVTLSSREEGMGSVLLDAMVFGKPVVATHAGGIPEVVREGETGLLVPVGDAEAFGVAIVSLLRDKNRDAQFSSAARMRASSFSLDVMASRTRALYTHVIQTR